jgi:hypothetical protein
MPFPCDRHLASASDAYFRAVDVAASPPVVFRWLCQLKVAPYSYDWIDNFGRTSPRSLTPGLEDLEVGQRFMEFFALVEFERDRHLTSLTKLPFAVAPFGEIAVTYLVLPRGRSASRLVVKMVVRYPRGVLGWVERLLLPWGDLVMMRKQLLTLKELAETQARVEPKRVQAMADAGTRSRAVR